VTFPEVQDGQQSARHDESEPVDPPGQATKGSGWREGSGQTQNASYGEADRRESRSATVCHL
jgi:hypothetical protein